MGVVEENLGHTREDGEGKNGHKWAQLLPSKNKKDGQDEKMAKNELNSSHLQ